MLGHPIANDELYCPGGVGYEACPRLPAALTAPDAATAPVQHPTGEQLLFYDDLSAGNPLRAMLSRAQVPWCKSCEWALASMSSMASQPPTPPDVAVADAEPADAEAVAVAAVAGAPTAAGGCIWLHALEYRFTLDGDRYCFRSPLPEFVWGEAVPDGDSFCGKVVAAE